LLRGPGTSKKLAEAENDQIEGVFHRPLNLSERRSMEKVAALPTQIILFVDNLTRELRLAKSAETLDAAREKVSAAIELAEQINKVACDAAAEIGASIPMSHD
jgi:hypothetical protein